MLPCIVSVIIDFDAGSYWPFYRTLTNVFTLVTFLLHRVLKTFSTSSAFVRLLTSVLSHVLSNITNISIGVVTMFTFDGV